MLYFKYVKMLIKSIMQYKLALWMGIAGQLLVSFFAFLGIYLLFDRFGNIDGWTFSEVALCFAVVSMSFSITECFARGFDTFSQCIVKGDFDRLLLRPRGLILQVFGSNLDIGRIGRLAQSIITLWLALSWLDVTFTAAKIFTLIFMILSGVFIFTGIFILGATICFFTVQGLEVVNIFTHGGRELASYPLNIYNKWIIRFFTFIIPFGCFNYLPLMYITDKAGGNELLYMLTPLMGILFIVPCIFVWRFGVRRYMSTGS